MFQFTFGTVGWTRRARPRPPPTRGRPRCPSWTDVRSSLCPSASWISTHVRWVSYNTLSLSLSGVATPLLRNYNYEHDPNSDRVHSQQGGLAAGPGHVALLSLHRGCVLQQPGLQVRLTRSSHSFSKGL